MQRFLKILFTLSLLIGVGCARTNLTLVASGPAQDVRFVVRNKGLKSPLQFANRAPGAKGTFYFETEQGRTYLRGQPDSTEKQKGGFHGRWVIAEGLDERTVEVRFVPDDKRRFDISLTADYDADILGWGFALRADPDEFFTGLMERVVDGDQELSWSPGLRAALNLRGQQVEMNIKPTLSVYGPFYLSSRGYGLLVEGFWPGRYDLCKSHAGTVQVHFEGPSLNMKLFMSRDPVQIVQAHAMDVGPPLQPPLWTFRPWRWRSDQDNRETYYDGTRVEAPYNGTVVEDILMMEALEIPCAAYLMVRPWAIGPFGYGDFTWDVQRLPEPKAMVGWLAERDVNFMLWIAPWVAGDMAKYAQRQNFGVPGQVEGKPDRVLVDFTHPTARLWWQDSGPYSPLWAGAAGFRLDLADEFVPDTLASKIAGGATDRENHNAYPVQYMAAVWEVAGGMRKKDFALTARAAYTGSTQYGTVWGGEIPSTPEGLRAAIIALQRCAVLGYPVWGSDVGGHGEGPLDPELTARWLAFGCFSPIMQVGPTRGRAFWDMPGDPRYDRELIATWRLYATLHDRLAKYSFRQAKAAHKKGTPIVRPLFLAYPDQPEAWRQWDSYLYGPDLLVKTLWSKGRRGATVWLPQGEKWIDAWDPQKVYQGGQRVKVATPPHKIPIFIRRGSDLELGDLNELYKESYKLTRKPPDLAALQKAAFGKTPEE